MSEDQHQSAERQSFLELTRSIAGLPLDQAAAILETSAAIAGISLRAGIEFLRAAPAAAHVLQPAEIALVGGDGPASCNGRLRIRNLIFCRRRRYTSNCSTRSSSRDLCPVYTTDGPLNCRRSRDSSFTAVFSR